MASGPDLARLLLAITAKSESGNRDYTASGEPVRSPAGALYKMQVLPSTAASPGYGVAPAAAQTPEEYNRVGGDLLNAFLKKYQDPAKAWAAYQSGPGNLEKWTQQYGSNWQQGLGPQGRNYINNNLKALGQSPTPQAPAPTQSPLPTEAPMDETDDATGALPSSGFGAKDVMDLYKQNSMSASIVAAAKAKAREEQFNAGQAALAKQRFGPSLSERLFALSAALGTPTRDHSFGGMMSRVAPALSSLVNGNRTAEEQRAEALRQLQNTYTNEGLDAQQGAVDARVKMLPALVSLAKQSVPSPGVWDTNRGMFIPKTGPVPVGSGVAGGVPFIAYSDGTHHVKGADGKEVVYNAAGQQVSGGAQ